MAIFRVPMVGGTAGDGVDIFALEDAAVIFVDIAAAVVLGGEPTGMVGIDISDRDQVAQPTRLVADTRTPTAHADCTDVQLVARGSLFASASTQRGRPIQEQSNSPRCRTTLEKLPPREILETVALRSGNCRALSCPVA